MTAQLYALANQVCGHIVSVGNNQAQLADVKAQLALLGRFSWAVREATDSDMEAVVAGRRCRVCDLTPVAVL